MQSRRSFITKQALRYVHLVSFVCQKHFLRQRMISVDKTIFLGIFIMFMGLIIIQDDSALPPPKKNKKPLKSVYPPTNPHRDSSPQKYFLTLGALGLTTPHLLFTGPEEVEHIILSAALCENENYRQNNKTSGHRSRFLSRRRNSNGKCPLHQIKEAECTSHTHAVTF